MNRLEAALEVFGSVKQSGANGEKIATQVLHVQAKIAEIVTNFELGSQDPAWVDSLVHMAGPETFEYAQQVYLVLKETQAKLDALG